MEPSITEMCIDAEEWKTLIGKQCYIQRLSMLEVGQYKPKTKTKVFNLVDFSSRLSEFPKHRHNKLISGAVTVSGTKIMMFITTRVCYQ